MKSSHIDIVEKLRNRIFSFFHYFGFFFNHSHLGKWFFNSFHERILCAREGVLQYYIHIPKNFKCKQYTTYLHFLTSKELEIDSVQEEPKQAVIINQSKFEICSTAMLKKYKKEFMFNVSFHDKALIKIDKNQRFASIPKS